MWRTQLNLTLPMLHQEIVECDRCILRKAASQVVPGCGNNNPKIVFIAEHPEAGEDIEGEAFVDRAGYSFKTLVKSTKLFAHSYFTYLVKCKPAWPLDDASIQCCKYWLWKEIQTTTPLIIATLGQIPTRILLKSKKSLKLSDVVGQLLSAEYTSAKIAPWYSINYLLNQGKAKELETTKWLETLYAMVEKMVH